MSLAAVAFTTARSLLNDAAGTLWTDTVLLPFLQEAHRELQVRLDLEGIPVIKNISAILSVPSGNTNLSQLPGFPTNLVKPELLKERKVGQLDRDFIEMNEVSFIPNEQQTDRLRYWSWIGEQITTLGATGATEVLIRYWGGLALPLSGADNLGFLYAENYIGPRTAAIAAGSVGNDTIRTQQGTEADAKLDFVIRMNVKGMQNLPVRRRPYRRRWSRIMGV